MQMAEAAGEGGRSATADNKQEQERGPYLSVAESHRIYGVFCRRQIR